MTYANTHTYTFKLLRENPEYFIENIVLHYNTETQSYDEYLLQYDVSEDEFIDIANGGALSENANTYISKLVNGTFSSNLNRITCGYSCITVNIPCTGEPPHAFGDTSCPYIGNTGAAYQIQSCGASCTANEDPSLDDTSNPIVTGGGGSTVFTNPYTLETCTQPSGARGFIGMDGACVKPLSPIQRIEQCLGITSSWLDDPNNSPTVTLIDNYLEENQCSEEAQAFSEAVIDAGSGADVDYVENRINGIKLDISLPDCVSNMILKFMFNHLENSINNSTNTTLIDDVFSALGSGMPINERDFITTYKVDNIPGNGKTEVVFNATTQKYEATITLSQNLINNGTKLAIAKTILHESIHAFLKYTAYQFPQSFNNPDGDFSTLVAAWNVHNDLGYAQHVYMANLVEDMATDIGLFASENYFYPNPNTSPASLFHYEAIAWSGIAYIADPINPNAQIINPVFSNNYPNAINQQQIIDIFTSENTGVASGSSTPMINNNCN